MAFSIANPLNADPLDGMGGSSGFSLTQNYAAGAYSPVVSLPTGSGSGEQPDWLKVIDDIVGAADKVTSIYERYDYPAWKRALDAKEIERYRAAQEQAKAAQTQAAAGSAGGVPWVWVAVAAAGVVALVLVLK